MRDGWSVNNIPINEKVCSVTVYYKDKEEINSYHNNEACSFSG